MRQTKAKKQRTFLKALRNCLGVAPSADAAGISRATAYRWREQDPAFAQAWDDAIQAGIDDLEARHFTAAKEKDTLSRIHILKSHRGDTYGDRGKIDVAHSITAPERPQQNLIFTAEALAILARGAKTLTDPVDAAKPVTELAPEAPNLPPDSGQT